MRHQHGRISAQRTKSHIAAIHSSMLCIALALIEYWALQSMLMNLLATTGAMHLCLQILQKSQQMARNEFELDYDERNPFVIGTFTACRYYTAH
jgi:Coatomer (COPI) alpha subunit C-terminus